jgi:uncharacterized protein (TIGR03435 family)
MKEFNAAMSAAVIPLYMSQTIVRLPLLFAAFCAVFGQSTVTQPPSWVTQPTFEVASVKPTPPSRQNTLRMDYCSAGGRFTVSGTPVMWSLTYAFRVKDYQVADAPAWLNAFDSAYDIEAKPAGPVDNAACRLMVQSLLRDRFRLTQHRETREASVYFLTVGKSGVKMHEGGQVRLNRAVQVDASGKPDWPDGWTMPLLAGHLSDYVDRPVVDRTGVAGKYGVELEFSRRDGDDRPSIFTAVQDQLGLRLEAGKAPIEMLVIDHIEKASEN